MTKEIEKRACKKQALFCLAQFCAGGDGIVYHQQVQLFLTLLGVDSGDQHTAGLLTHHLTGRQVHNSNQGLADQLLGLVVLGNAGEDLTVGAGAVVQGKLQQLVALLDILTVLDLHRPEIGLAEGVEIHVLGLKWLSSSVPC